MTCLLYTSKEAFTVINKRTKENPIQILVKAVENAAPREETTRIKYGGIGYQVAVDIAPQRRVDLAIGFITKGALQSAFKRKKSAGECLAEELMLAVLILLTTMSTVSYTHLFLILF